MLSSDYPYIQYKSTEATLNGSYGELFTSANNCIIDSILAVNATSHSAKLNINLLKNYAAGSVEVPLFSRLEIKANETVELIKYSNIYLESFDAIVGYVDFSDNKITFILSYRETNQQSGLSPPLTIDGNTATDDIILSEF
ncbi:MULTISPECIES: hypothetical protein [Cysteiniphilum]|uniref:hypothetical protein n=1 Tax=Cysteiniphilum TaxID=2056696 RepID=UPI00177BB41E|nr:MULTISPECIES: hypothetical protein [Cysteiniphilum]